MYRTPKKLAALLLALVMVFSCIGITTFAAGDGDPKVTENTIRGTADTEGFSTLKAHTDADLTVPGDPVTYTGAATISAGASHKLDAANARIEVVEGDGYYVDQLIFNGSAAENITVNSDGTLSFEMHTGDLTWNQQGYNVQEGGVEWSAQGGDLNGRYYIRLKISGLTCDGEAAGDVIVPVYVYIYGREFSDMASPQNPGTSKWGSGNMGEAVLPFAKQSRKTENAVTLKSDPNGLTWVWDIAPEGEAADYSTQNTAGEILLADKATDNLYITWPAGVDASGVTADDVTITLSSEYGDTKVLAPGGDEHVAIDRYYNGEQLEIPGGDYAVFKNPEGETIISINYVHWFTTPVYTTMNIVIDVNGTKYEETFPIDSVYLYTVQTGGGLDLAQTVTVQNFYGIANIDKFTATDFFTESFSYYAYNGAIQRPDAEVGSVYGTYTGTLQNKGGFDVEWTLTLNEDGSYHLHQYFAMMGTESDWYGSAWGIGEDGWVSLGPVDTDRSSGLMGTGWGDNGESCWLVDVGSKLLLERDEDFIHFTAPAAAVALAAASMPVVLSTDADADYVGTYTGVFTNPMGLEINWTLQLNEDGTYVLYESGGQGDKTYTGTGWTVEGETDKGIKISCGPLDADSEKPMGSGFNKDDGSYSSVWYIDVATGAINDRDDEGGGTPGGTGGSTGGTGGTGGSTGGMGGSTGVSGSLFLYMDENGDWQATEDKDDPRIKLAYPDYVSAPELRGNGYFYYSGTANIQALKDDTIDVEYNGYTYTFARKLVNSTSKVSQCLGAERLKEIGAELLPGYIASPGGFGSEKMNCAWAVFLRDPENDVGWTVDVGKLPSEPAAPGTSDVVPDVPETGDTLALWVAMTAISAGLVGVVVFGRKKEEHA